MMKTKAEIFIIISNVRSAHNVGSILRSADGLGVKKVYMSGITPYPRQVNDKRLPHVIKNTENKLHKSALGAERFVQTEYWGKTLDLLNHLKTKDIHLVALEQQPQAMSIHDWKPPKNVALALIVGNETSGLNSETLAVVDQIVEIPMNGKKESLNVAAAASIGMFYVMANNLK